MATGDRSAKAASDASAYLAGTHADVRSLPAELQAHLQVLDRGEASCPPALLGAVMIALTNVGLPLRGIGYVRELDGQTQSGDYASYEGFSVEESLRWVRPGLEHVRPTDSTYLTWWTTEDLARYGND